ncbi:MAG: hypothetical protein HQL27_00245 [Candidatus Omnitrophica bacterium]|nr:hypothetical protein [Candidatus Omnitrophota bacterium]
MLTDKEKKVAGYFSKNELEISPRPFTKAAAALLMQEEELIAILNKLSQKKIIKNLRGVLNHKRAGYAKNALIAWNMDGFTCGNKDEFIKKTFIDDDRISHCYKRTPHKSFNYDTFTMMHAKSVKEIRNFVNEKGAGFRIKPAVLFTRKELKKEMLSLGSLL